MAEDVDNLVDARIVGGVVVVVVIITVCGLSIAQLRVANQVAEVVKEVEKKAPTKKPQRRRSRSKKITETGEDVVTTKTSISETPNASSAESPVVDAVKNILEPVASDQSGSESSKLEIVETTASSVDLPFVETVSEASEISATAIASDLSDPVVEVVLEPLPSIVNETVQVAELPSSEEPAAPVKITTEADAKPKRRGWWTR